jgi:hypothetical protein
MLPGTIFSCLCSVPDLSPGDDITGQGLGTGTYSALYVPNQPGFENVTTENNNGLSLPITTMVLSPTICSNPVRSKDNKIPILALDSAEYQDQKKKWLPKEKFVSGGAQSQTGWLPLLLRFDAIESSDCKLQLWTRVLYLI